MQRLASITAMASLVSAMLLPAMPKLCMGPGMSMAEHRDGMHQHHCEEMQEQAGQTDQTEADASLFSVNKSDSPQKCPMNCCACRKAGVNQEAAIVPEAALSTETVAQERVFVQDIAFSNNGFSSHTDRGPPSIEL
jgi:hypothetical protein